MLFRQFESVFSKEMQALCSQNPDPSHDFAHVLRVVSLAKKLGSEEGADLEVVVPAAYLHDFEPIAKNDPRRSMASSLSAQKAAPFLRDLGYSQTLVESICHAIQAHSFSANISPRTLEAKVVQDADRLDGIGAIGVARCFSMSGLLRRDFYDVSDPFCDDREPNDQHNSLDHFFVKLLGVAHHLHTESGRREGRSRAQFLEHYVRQLRAEIALEP